MRKGGAILDNSARLKETFCDNRKNVKDVIDIKHQFKEGVKMLPTACGKALKVEINDNRIKAWVIDDASKHEIKQENMSRNLREIKTLDQLNNSYARVGTLSNGEFSACVERRILGGGHAESKGGGGERSDSSKNDKQNFVGKCLIEKFERNPHEYGTEQYTMAHQLQDCYKEYDNRYNKCSGEGREIKDSYYSSEKTKQQDKLDSSLKNEVDILKVKEPTFLVWKNKLPSHKKDNLYYTGQYLQNLPDIKGSGGNILKKIAREMDAEYNEKNNKKNCFTFAYHKITEEARITAIKNTPLLVRGIETYSKSVWGDNPGKKYAEEVCVCLAVRLGAWYVNVLTDSVASGDMSQNDLQLMLMNSR